MKILVLFLVSMTFISCTEDTNANSNKSAKVEIVDSKEVLDGLPEEDCDDKFEKAQEEKKVDEENLFGQNNEGDEGCTIE